MRANWKSIVVGLLVAASAAAGSQDFSGLKGGSDRLGRNAAPATSGPGESNLRWWRPNLLDGALTSAVVDNLDPLQNSSTFPALLPWQTVTDIGEWAESPFVPDDNADPAVFPAYRYHFSTAASLNLAQPHVPFNAAQHATWTFAFDTNNIGNVPRNYALYVWLPIGPTRPGLGASRYTIRYFVYEVFYGNGLSELQVVDTYNSGFGWVRLGQGGTVTNRMYNYDGATPIRIVLHNTVVRDVFGNLTETLDTGNVTLNPLVYADAALAIPETGGYRASPVVTDLTPLGAPTIRTVAALNELSIAINGTTTETITKGVVSSYTHDGTPGFDAPNNKWWRYSPLEEDASLTVYQDDAGAGFTPGPSWTAQIAPPGFRGVGFHDSDVTDVPILAQDCLWQPTLADGSYEVWAWVPGSTVGLTLSRDVTYTINEGVTTSTIVVNQDSSSGWVRLGTRRFNHDTLNLLEVRVTNLGPVSELGRKVYADQLRFLGATNTAINSTPIQVIARVNVPTLGGLIDRPVVVVAGENGKLYCLDAVGNADGTTNVYWTYPSTPDPDNTGWTDPNQVAGEDGPNGIAQMPTGFDLSSALIERIGAEDYLYIAATNGRVYCIEMSGRGDMNLTTRNPGTTRRRWSFPDDYPAIARPGTLGAAFGSVAFSVTAAGPTLFVPTTQGRIYALDASGNPGNKTTTVRWAFPLTNAPTLGPCEMTPAVEFNRVFVGFRRAQSENAGRFFALNDFTGVIDWEFNGTTAWDPAGLTVINADDFVSGPTVIPAGEFAAQGDTVVVANDNRWITALSVATGAVLWTTDELGSPVLGNLSYSPLTVFDTGGNPVAAPNVLVPTQDGRFNALFAEATTSNVFGANFRLSWGWETNTSLMETSIAVGRNWMYGTDTNGMLYAFNDTLGGVIPGGGSMPGQGLIPPNDPLGIPFRGGELRFITKAAYERLRLPEGHVNQLTYAQARSAPNLVSGNAFEWGETIYALVTNIPAEVDSNPDPSERTQVEFRFSAEGVAVRNLVVRSKAFPQIGAGNPPIEPISGEVLDGFAVLSYTLQGSGTNALPPGSGVVSFGVNAQFAQNGPFRSVAINPLTSRRPFTIANPIGIEVKDQVGNYGPNFGLGVTTNAADPEALANGSPDIPTTAKLENRILSSVGLAQHNASKGVVFRVYDRSLMTLLRGPDRGLDLIRVDRSDLVWQGGAAAVYKPINQLAYPNFEDSPSQFPNISLDYPNIRRESFTIIKDKFGATENPVLQSVQLIAPTIPDRNFPNIRTLNPTPMDFEINVPRFQPPNATDVVDSSAANVDAGYYGGLTIFVDGTGNGQFDRRGRREAFRQMWLGGSVDVDEKMSVNRTELDLGSLPQGAGFDPIAPWFGASTFSPWIGPYQGMFQTFQVLNQGNTNLLNLRVAKSYDYGAALLPWGLYAPANNDRSWIDTQYNLWSDIDSRHALTPNVLLQKSRVGDRSPTDLLTNPIRRDNYNLGAISSWLLLTPAPAQPRMAVTVPLGTPVGSYLTDIFVIEDGDVNESLEYDNAAQQLPREIRTDPFLRLKFNVRETRLTNGHTQLAAPMVHGQVTGNEPFLHQNVQPTAMRDLDGQMIVAYCSSNDLAWGQPQPAAAGTNNPWRIYIATIDGMSQTAGGVVGSNPLRDLNSWSPQAGRWFRQSFVPGPFPTQPLTTLFGANVIASTAKFGSPAFSGLGGLNPFNTSQNANPFLAYVGEAQIQQPAGREYVSQIMMSRLAIDNVGTVTDNGGPWIVDNLLNVQKTKPAVLQVLGRATVFFGTIGTGQSGLYYSHFNGGAFGNSTKIDLGSGFESVGSVSVIGRIYQGINRVSEGLSAGDPLTELMFTGKLRGRANREVFLSRLRTNGNGQPINVPGTRSPLLAWGQQADSLVPSGDPNTFATRGVYWQTTSVVDLTREIVPGVPQSLIVPNTKKIDTETGMISAELYSGGSVYFDSAQGIVRFTGFRPNTSQNIRVVYTPRFLRMSTVSTASYSNPSIVWDNRFTGEFDYYALPGGGNPFGAQIPADRYTLVYGRAAAGAGQTSRPYIQSMRFGHQFTVNGKPVALHTQPNGNLTNLTFSTPPTGPFQVDPASGRIYYSSLDEGRLMVVSSFTYVDEASGAPILVNVAQNAPAILITERSELPVAIESAVNESQMFSFIDPFDNANAADRRPGLIWMLWSSTRTGSSDIYLQSVAPKYVPRPVGRNGN